MGSSRLNLQAFVRWDDEDKSRPGRTSSRHKSGDAAFDGLMHVFMQQYHLYMSEGHIRNTKDMRDLHGYTQWLEQKRHHLPDLDDISEQELRVLAASIIEELDAAVAEAGSASVVWTDMAAIDRAGKDTKVEVPGDWTGVLAARKLQQTKSGVHDHVYVAPYALDEARRLAVTIRTSRLEDTSHEIRIMNRLRSSGNVLTLFGSKELPEKTYMLTQATDMSLKELMDFKAATKADDAMFVPLERSIPILIDLLRGARDLSKAGIVLGSITQDSVLISNGRPLLSDFMNAVVMRKADAHFGRGDTTNFKYDDRWKSPPETIRGQPTGPTNDVWHIGLLFARMCLGFEPIEGAVIKTDRQILGIPQWDPLVLDRIQDVVRRQWSATRDPEIQSIRDEDARSLLEGLLDVDIGRRWDAVGALAEAIEIAQRRGIEVPPERPAVEPLYGLPSDWQ